MANTDTEPTIEALLEQRTQYEEWLLRLDTSGEKASPSVRQRVRGDYQARLDGVMEQLRGRNAAISEELERQHASQAEIDRERRRAEEALAEAEVRHTVGEYDEGEWKRLNDQSKKEIEQLRSRLRSIGAEITRLTEIQALIAAPRAGTAAPAAPSAPSAPAPPRPAKPQVIEEAPMVTHLAESFNVKVAPHFLMELHVSLACAVPNAHYVEHIPQLRAITSTEIVISGGRALAPSAPGLGIDWDLDSIDALRVA